MIVLSGAGDKSASLDAIRAGAHDFLSKPVDPDVLLVVLEAAPRAAWPSSGRWPGRVPSSRPPVRPMR